MEFPQVRLIRFDLVERDRDFWSWLPLGLAAARPGVRSLEGKLCLSFSWGSLLDGLTLITLNDAVCSLQSNVILVTAITRLFSGPTFLFLTEPGSLSITMVQGRSLIRNVDCEAHILDHRSSFE